MCPVMHGTRADCTAANFPGALAPWHPRPCRTGTSALCCRVPQNPVKRGFGCELLPRKGSLPPFIRASPSLQWLSCQVTARPQWKPLRSWLESGTPGLLQLATGASAFGIKPFFGSFNVMWDWRWQNTQTMRFFKVRQVCVHVMNAVVAGKAFPVLLHAAGRQNVR